MKIKSTLFVVGAAACICCAKAAPVSKPNIVIIYTDDQGYGDMSLLNPESKFQTPNMDRLAKEGINFTHGHSGGTACTPSRYALLTGRYSWRTKLKTGVGNANEESLIAEDRLTLPQMLKDEGYNTACIGKWHLGMILPGSFRNYDWSKPILEGPVDRGFDYWFGIPTSPKTICAWFENRGLAPGAAEPTLLTYHKLNGDLGPRWRINQPFYEDLDDQPKETIQTTRFKNEAAPDWEDSECLNRFTDKAIEWMQGKEADVKNGKPFFVYYALTSPHEPVAPTEPFIGKSGCSGYGDFCIETDHHVGRILDYLDESGLAENTLVLFSSDNGPEHTWKERIPEFGHDSSGVLRDGKRSHYEGGHRVPFAIRWPAKIQAGRVWDKPVQQPDFMATVAEIIGTKLPENTAEDSQSIADILFNAESSFEHLPLIAYNNRGGQCAITDGKWKLVLPGQKKGELYDLDADIGEKNNLISKYPEVAEALQAKTTDIVCNGRTTPGPKASNDTGWWKSIAWMSPEEYKANHPEGEPLISQTKGKKDKSKKKK
ncbi:sulfatase family protein [Pontiella sulfatireligans]|uniref:Arylsulfatase n=1 Tax=Pontiella sulfatireligans TaxID=2750658 RepID=A0A6C2UGL6_9BACT|nr:arylsulfatase [Pontiella sulfatireligans]SPS74192.1 sulfatase S1_15 [Kiritimatiellales bacterium]VGO18561.1 Arylsulfatase [Pontiella sulfatireligans]